MAFDKAKAIRAAEKSLAQGKIPAAIQEYRRIVEEDPEDYTAQNTLGDLYARTGKKDEAVSCYKRVAEHYRVQGFALKAIAMYKKVMRFTPDDPDLSLALASLYEQLGLMVDARAQYMMVAESHARRGETREALEVLQRVADLDPHNIDIRLRLAEGLGSEGLYDLSADAFNAAGDRLAGRGEHERALEAYRRSLEMRPQGHAALHGFLTAHIALGTSDEAAEELEKAIASRPGDLELRAMLVRAYVEGENAPQAERATRELVARDAKSYTYSFEVARLYLQLNDFEQATRLLSQAVEPALAERNDGPLVELLEEVLRRDPEHIPALRQLVRVHEWQRDDERLRTALERLAESAEAARAVEEERAALSQLVRLVPDAPRYRERLAAIGGAPQEEESPAEDPPAGGEVPSFESFMLTDSMFAPPAPSVTTSPETGETEFTWTADTTDEPPPGADAGGETVTFASAREEFTTNSGETLGPADAASQEAPPPSFEDFQEIAFDVSGGVAAPGHEEARHDSDSRVGVERMLAQELEGVDFYISQGYVDIAREALDGLERQFGTNAKIDERRGRLDAQATTTAGAFAVEPVEGGAVETDEVDDLDAAFTGLVAEAPAAPAPPDNRHAPPVAAAPAAPAKKSAGIDPGLAEVFDEFREALEDGGEQEATADYETHYDLGLAYKDIGLYDQAVEAFQTAITACAPGDGTSRYLHCCNMLGHCFMQKGMPKAAALWFRKGLEAPGHTEDAYQALRYELGTAYEQMGDTKRAIDTFTEVYGISVSYRGVADKLRELQEQQAGK
ncbi:MAG TPA: tetratricopeptide repeat protein [Pyrinomonadaceae bacterium]|nr:tetratricopeptide repeat protein [Pyrinomonadaceae bacterium]